MDQPLVTDDTSIYMLGVIRNRYRKWIEELRRDIEILQNKVADLETALQEKIKEEI